MKRKLKTITGNVTVPYGTLKRCFNIPVQAIWKHGTVFPELKHHTVMTYGRADTHCTLMKYRKKINRFTLWPPYSYGKSS
jgi:hypothetical protein